LTPGEGRIKVRETVKHRITGGDVTATGKEEEAI
jgi:hypothetical protein